MGTPPLGACMKEGIGSRSVRATVATAFAATPTGSRASNTAEGRGTTPPTTPVWVAAPCGAGADAGTTMGVVGGITGGGTTGGTARDAT